MDEEKCHQTGDGRRIQLTDFSCRVKKKNDKGLRVQLSSEQKQGGRDEIQRIFRTLTGLLLAPKS